MTSSKDLTKKQLYESVKELVENQEPHILLPQQKLFTLFSIALQYMMFTSIKQKGIYLLRIEDANLASKLCKKAKDPISRKFMEKIILPRRTTYQGSSFYMDYFNPNTWGQFLQVTEGHKRNQLKMALVVKNTSTNPFAGISTEVDEGPEEIISVDSLSNMTFHSTLKSVVPETITIAYNFQIPELSQISFPFIVDDDEKPLNGVKISKNLDW